MFVRKILLSALICLLAVMTTVPSFAQSRDITKDEFWNALFKARDASAKLDRRETWKTETFKKGKAIEINEWNDEYLLPERSRRIHIVKSNGKTTRTELITIGYSEFCRKNKGEWVLSDCREMKLSSGASPTRSKYHVKETKFNNLQVMLYVEYLEFGEGKAMSFKEFQYWVDAEGRMVAEKIVYGTIKPRSISYSMNARFEYNPKNLNIEAPLKLGNPTIK